MSDDSPDSPRLRTGWSAPFPNTPAPNALLDSAQRPFRRSLGAPRPPPPRVQLGPTTRASPTVEKVMPPGQGGSVGGFLEAHHPRAAKMRTASPAVSDGRGSDPRGRSGDGWLPSTPASRSASPRRGRAGSALGFRRKHLGGYARHYCLSAALAEQATGPRAQQPSTMTPSSEG